MFALELRCGETPSKNLGTHAECGETTTVTAEGPRRAVQAGAEAGWRVDDPMVGYFSRSDTCPRHNTFGRGRPWQIEALLARPGHRVLEDCATIDAVVAKLEDTPAELIGR